jgi:hypothetical protein
MGETGRRGSKLNLRDIALPFLTIVSSAGPIGGSAAMAASSCKFVEEATLPASFKNGEILVDVAIDGTAAKFRLGTHSAFTQISRSMAQRLHLPIRSGGALNATSQGTVWLDSAIVSAFEIGGKVASTTSFQVIDEGGDGTTDESAGVVGQNYLSNFDVELDPALNRVNLFTPIACPADAAYWANEHFELPVAMDGNRRPRVRVTLDGKAFFAFLDTGRLHSTIDFAVAKLNLDMPADIDAPQPTRKIGGVQPPNPIFTFKELVFGPITIRHPQIELQRYRPLATPNGIPRRSSASDDAPVIIGMDIIGKFHSMISVQNGMLYFTLPNERLSAAGSPP